MIEVQGPESVAADLAAAAPAAGDTAGALLRRSREAAGLHLAAMAVALKVPMAKLEALEQDRHEALPDAVFVRALAAAVCRHLKIDPRPVLERLPHTAAPRLVQDSDGINAPFRSPRDGFSSDWREQLTRPVSLAVLALLLGALVVLLLPHTQLDDSALAVPAGDTGGVAAAPATAAGPPAGGEAAGVPPSALATPLAPTGIMPASVSVPGPARSVAAPAAAEPTPAEPAAREPSSAASAAAAAPAAAASGVVVFRAKAASWIEVRDAKGAVAVRKLMEPGEAATASGAMPLQITVGKADATEVQVRGKPFDLRPFARDNVARFEVK